MTSVVLDTLADAPWKELSLDLPLFTIYDHPSDFPDKFVVRIWDGREAQPTPYCSLWDTLDDARADIPSGRVNLNRNEGDDAKIVETWI